MSEAQEQLRNNVESRAEVSESAAKQLERITNKHESSTEQLHDKETQAEKARDNAMEKAVSVEAGGREKDKSGAAYTTPGRRGTISKQQLNKSYRQTIKHVQDELPTLSRGFSKVIHNPVIEKTSEITGNTIARPNAILAGGFMAFALTLIIYVTAKKIGYTLSGFETIGAFVVGWVIGLIFDYFRLLFTGKDPN